MIICDFIQECTVWVRVRVRVRVQVKVRVRLYTVIYSRRARVWGEDEYNE